MSENERLVNFYLKKNECDLQTLFIKAYVAYFGGVLDRFEIKANIDRYKVTRDPPPYLRWFLNGSVH